jgi:uncharacterized tellurite resistance protein B-like protein
MLTTGIQKFLSRRMAPSDAPEPSFSPEDLAAAALLVECSRVDREQTDEERSKIVAIVRERCGLDHETAECLVSVAERRQDAVWHNWLFTSTIRDAYDAEASNALVEHLWEIAAADGAIHAFEARLIERIARELGVPDEGVAASRARVVERLGLEETGA